MTPERKITRGLSILSCLFGTLAIIISSAALIMSSSAESHSTATATATPAAQHLCLNGIAYHVTRERKETGELVEVLKPMEGHWGKPSYDKNGREIFQQVHLKECDI